MDSITNVRIGDIVVCFDEYMHDYVEHRLRVDCIEEDAEAVTESNPKGIVLYGEDLTDSDEDSMITRVGEENFVCKEVA